MQEEDCQSVTSPIRKVGPVIDGENMMLRRNLLEVPQSKESTERKTFFRTTCKSHGKICKVILDSGSTENIVTIEMVDNLKLNRFPHTTPYKVSLLRKGYHVLVDEQAWVDFEIGDYKDRVICDIFPMDEYHFLLGFPWKFDVKSIHDGKKNLYHNTKGGKKF